MKKIDGGIIIMFIIVIVDLVLLTIEYCTNAV